MNWIDLAILPIVAGAGYWGYFNGFVKLAEPTIFIAVGIAMASRWVTPFASAVTAILEDVEQGRAWTDAIATHAAGVERVILGVIAVGALYFIGRSLLSRVPYPEGTNERLGLVLGVVIGVLLLSVIFGLQVYPDGYRARVEGSPLAGLLADNFEAVIRGVIVPEGWAEGWAEELSQLQQ